MGFETSPRFQTVSRPVCLKKWDNAALEFRLGLDGVTLNARV